MTKRLLPLLLLLIWLPSCAPGNSPAVPESSSTAAPIEVTASNDHPTTEIAPEVSGLVSESSLVPASTAPAFSPEPSPTAAVPEVMVSTLPEASVAPPIVSPVLTSPPLPDPTPTLVPSPSLSAEDASPAPEALYITIAIEGPEGMILEAVDTPFTEGMTAAQALIEVCAAQEIEVEIRSSGTKRAYIISIGGFAEKTQGAGSGWVYLHNGELGSSGIGQLKPASGDRLRFCYTLDWGADAVGKDN